MRKSLVLAGIAILALSSCQEYYTGQLVGVVNRPRWYQEDPYGMVYMPMGSYNMGESDQDVPQNFVTQSKTVSVQAFYMDQTEISNNEYRQFVYYVRDSLVRTMLGENLSEEDYLIVENEYGEEIDPPLLNWRSRIDDDVETREALEDLYHQ